MTSIKPNIVIVTSEFPPQPGGIGNHAYNLAVHLHTSGFEVSVIADQRSKTGKEEIAFDTALGFEVKRVSRQNFRFSMYLKRILFTFQYMKNVTHCIATGKFSLWNVAFINLFYRRKTMAVIHGTEVNFKSTILKKSIDIALKQFDKIVAVSNYTKELVSHLKKDVEVIPNGIRISDWTTTAEAKSLKGNPILTTVGRISPRKGQLNVIRHLPELIKQYPEIHYHCVGIDKDAERCLKEAESLNIDSYITFHGSVDDETLKQILNATDIFVMLSTESDTGDVEGFGIAILEANALGVPAIGTKGCGIEDAINDFKSGILIHNDASEFNYAIKEILKRMDDFRASSKHWAQRHSWDNIVKSYVKLISNQ